MRAINQSAQRILARIIARLPSDEVGASIRLDARPGTYMALSVERIGRRLYSLAHYGEQNGDLMADPEMIFWHGPDSRFYPTYIRNAYAGMERESVSFDEHERPTHFLRHEQADQAVFAGTWMKNIAHQQQLS